eukprot:413778-Rhodomonas_salina.4
MKGKMLKAKVVAGLRQGLAGRTGRCTEIGYGRWFCTEPGSGRSYWTRARSVPVRPSTTSSQVPCNATRGTSRAYQMRGTQYRYSVCDVRYRHRAWCAPCAVCGTDMAYALRRCPVPTQCMPCDVRY